MKNVIGQYVPFVVLFIALCSLPSALSAQVDIYGYFESQYTGIYLDTAYFQNAYNKLRVDITSTAVKNVEFGANVIFLHYFGATSWNVLDFLPADVTAAVSPDLYPYYQFTLSDSFFLDNIYARLNFRRCALTVGKQQISLGTGYFANPIDVLNTKDALDPTYEQPGHNAIRLDVYPANRMSIMALYTPIAFDWQNSGKLLRVKLGLGHFDFSITGYEYQYTTTDFYTFEQTQEQRRLFGADAVGELLGLGVWAEGGYTVIEDADDDLYEFITGGDYTFESGLYAMLEYHHNSSGKSDHTDYDLNDWMRFFTGEQNTIARDQMYGLIQYPLTDLIMVGGSVIFSISDGSAALVPMVYWSLYENVELTLMLNAYIGEEGKVFSEKLGNGGFIRANVYF
ncbi:MAG: hypothetical protein JSW02_05825 [candidate division WOR-3 bacterium]|nr:MAG: hypothetical protein JSW02_05825 [candidate division WOR-3 bacterium]